jgi:hypothetical protein
MSIRAISNVILAALFASALGAPASGYIKHIRHFTPSETGETSAQKLTFIMDKSLGNPENPKRFYIEDMQLSVLVDSAGQIDPKLLASDDSVELSFTADDIYWSIEPKSCTPQDGLPSKDWLFCAINDDKSGFVIETKPGSAAAPVLHFGKLRQGVDSAMPVPITYSENADFLVKEKGATAANRLVVSDDRAELVSVEMTDEAAESQPAN